MVTADTNIYYDQTDKVRCVNPRFICHEFRMAYASWGNIEATTIGKRHIISDETNKALIITVGNILVCFDPVDHVY